MTAPTREQVWEWIDVAEYSAPDGKQTEYVAALAYAAGQAAGQAAERDGYDTPYDAIEVAKIVLCDCGCSTEHEMLLQRVAKRLGRMLDSAVAAGRDECAKVEKQRDELLKIAKDVIGMLENCSVESGVCHCGDDMERHSSAMSCGHAPVDSGSTYAAHIYEKARAAIASVKGGE